MSRHHKVVAVLVATLGVGVATATLLWAMYRYAQLIIGQEYLQLPGNNGRFFPLLPALSVAGEAVTVLAWPATDRRGVPVVGSQCHGDDHGTSSASPPRCRTGECAPDSAWLSEGELSCTQR